MNFCKDCKHMITDKDGKQEFSKCGVIYYVNPVTGEKVNSFCLMMRDTGGECGPDAKLFEDK